jgi:hypothetical protein
MRSSLRPERFGAYTGAYSTRLMRSLRMNTGIACLEAVSGSDRMRRDCSPVLPPVLSRDSARQRRALTDLVASANIAADWILFRGGLSMRQFKYLIGAITAAAVFAFAGMPSALADAPPAVPGEPGCVGQTHADIAQDYRLFPGEPKGFGPLVRFFGNTPGAAANADIAAECAAP